MIQAVKCSFYGPKTGGGELARPKKLPTVLTEDEQERLLEQANPRYPTGERNQTMLCLMLNTGLRLAEVTALKWRDINLTTGKLMVRQGKGLRIVPYARRPTSTA